MTVTVVTPWQNHRELERDYWHAIRVAGDPPVIIIDNGSDPPLPNGLRLEENAGFSRACNVGLELSRTDAVLFLNNDILPIRDDWLRMIVEALEPGVLVGANLVHSRHGDVDGQPFPYLDGWCLGGLRTDLLELGGFDESYMEPAYFSDNDLSLRARAAGMILREANVGLHHKLNATAGHNERVDVATNLNRQRFQARARELMAVAA